MKLYNAAFAKRLACEESRARQEFRAPRVQRAWLNANGQRAAVTLALAVDPIGDAPRPEWPTKLERNAEKLQVFRIILCVKTKTYGAIAR